MHNFYYENLPDNWAKSSLRDVINLRCGVDLQLKLINIDEKGIPYITGASNFSEDGLIINRWTEYATNVSCLGDILITVKGTIGDISFNNVGYVHIARQIMSLTPIKGLSPKYLYYLILANKKKLVESKNGIIPGITKDSVLSLQIGIPPENEQKRIVAKIDELISIIETISANQESINKMVECIKHKILCVFFGENSSYKSYYNKYLLRDLFSFQNGYAFSSSFYSDEGVSIIRISNLDDGIVTTKDVIKTKEKNIDEKFIVKKGDLLIALSGATTGKMGVFNSDGLYYLNQRVGCIRITDSSKITANYRNYLFMYLREKILQNAHGDAQPNISGQKILSLSCCLPNIETQEKIAKYIAEIFYYLDCINNI